MFPRESGKAPDKLLFCNSKVTKNFSFVIAGESVPVNPLEARFRATTLWPLQVT
jgi:hypothetical protein